MADDRRHAPDNGPAETDPEARALSGNPDAPPRQPDDAPAKDEELLAQPKPQGTGSGSPAADGEGGSDQPGTTLPGYG